MHRLQVDAKDVADGDTITVYVDTKEARESAQVPDSVRNAVTRRSKELAKKNYAGANALQKQIFKAGYRYVCFGQLICRHLSLSLSLYLYLSLSNRDVA